ncbi:hypothetical protein [Streptomyces sp. NPDC014685]
MSMCVIRLLGDSGEAEFDRKLRLSHLRYLAGSESASTSLAENYVGFRGN